MRWCVVYFISLHFHFVRFCCVLIAVALCVSDVFNEWMASFHTMAFHFIQYNFRFRAWIAKTCSRQKCRGKYFFLKKNCLSDTIMYWNSWLKQWNSYVWNAASSLNSIESRTEQRRNSSGCCSIFRRRIISIGPDLHLYTNCILHVGQSFTDFFFFFARTPSC